MDETIEGYYDLFLTHALKRELQARKGSFFSEPLHKEAFWKEFPSHIASEVRKYLEERDEEIPDKKLYDTVRSILTDERFIRHVADSIIPCDGRKLKAILPPHEEMNAKARPILPDTPLATSALLTGASHTPKLYEQIKKELLTCDRADWLVSFIRMSGITPIMPALREFTSKHAHDTTPCLRIATTVYLGVTEPKAIKLLQELPNTEIRVSYDTKSTRLHAKSYIFHRNTGFGSAYIGSSNISKVAMDNGLEWNVKISQRELKHLWDATIASFDSHWEDIRTFEPCQGEQGIVRLRNARKMEQGHSTAASPMSFFDLHPYPYQEEALEDIARERSAGRNKHLIIAATGTGKTMIAAFDYKAFLKQHPGATLLFLAHRKEILEQALYSFRQVLKDGSFGCLIDKDNEPTNTTHWFCTIPSWLNQKDRFSAEHFQYVVVDEAHHSTATSYLNVLGGLHSLSLLGLTATPERMDGLDIVPHFGGSFTHELRLGDAINRALLCPFVYYGMSDAVDFSHVPWKSGKYDTAELEKKLVHNVQRAGWVLEQMNMRVEDITKRKTLGFCVSVEHARFMAQYCNERGVPALALTGTSPLEERNQAKQRIESGEICIIFTVDLFNEGVDIPMIDTVVFLRPTESVTVFLQQLGRGLRRSENKECLLVFDFIARQHTKFNYAQRFKALCSRSSTKDIQKMLQQGFSYLPTGCSITLEKEASERILENINHSIANLSRKKMVRELKEALRVHGKDHLSLHELLAEFGLESPEELYAKALPHVLHQLAKGEELHDERITPYEDKLKHGFMRLMHQNDAGLLQAVSTNLDTDSVLDPGALTSFYSVLWGASRPADTLDGLHQYVRRYDGLRQDLKELIQWTSARNGLFRSTQFPKTGSLKLHGHYTREQVLQALGMSTFEKAYPSREGVLKNQKMYVFFADINKNEDDFSPTTMYDDYAISDTLFHWQSQSTTTPQSETGKNFIHHEERDITIMLFIRKHKKTESGVSAPYTFLGPVRYVSHTGARPMSIKWKLEHAIPAHIAAWSKKAS